jgi:hypothetical protein
MDISSQARQRSEVNASAKVEVVLMFRTDRRTARVLTRVQNMWHYADIIGTLTHIADGRAVQHYLADVEILTIAVANLVYSARQAGPHRDRSPLRNQNETISISGGSIKVTDGTGTWNGS